VELFDFFAFFFRFAKLTLCDTFIVLFEIRFTY